MFVRSPYLPVWTIFQDPLVNSVVVFHLFEKPPRLFPTSKISTSQTSKSWRLGTGTTEATDLRKPEIFAKFRMEAPGYVEMFSENAVWWILPRKQTFWKYSFVVWRGKFRKEYSCSKSYTEKVGWEILRSWKIGLINGWEKIKGSWLFKTLERVTKKRKRKWRIPVGSQLYLGVWCKSPFS